MPTPDRESIEFESLIDRHLGKSFPGDRRKLLIAAHQTMRKNVMTAIGRYVRGETSSETHAARMNALIRGLIEEFSKILSPDELKLFVGCEPDGYTDVVDPTRIRPV